MREISAGQSVRNFGKVRDAVKIPDLVAIQKRNYGHFLQKDVAPAKRKCFGLEALFQEIFPIESYDKSMHLEYLYYELEKPHYTPIECRQLRLTYGYPLKISCRLHRKDSEDSTEQAIYLGEMPVMVGGGEFIINGAVRVMVSQLHRSPGVDFLIDSKEGDRVLHGGRVIPERGSWIEIGVTRKDVLVVKIDQSSKIPATIFLRAIDPDHSTSEEILRLFYPTKTVPAAKLTPIMWAVEPIVDKGTGEVIVKAGEQIGDRVSLIQQGDIDTVVSKEDITKWMLGNLECIWVPVELSEPDCENYLSMMEKVLKGRKKPRDTNLDRVLKYLEDRLMVEWPDPNHPESDKKHIPWFNREKPKGPTKVIKKAWDADVPKELGKIFKVCVNKVKGKKWQVGHKNIPDKPGVYIFRNTKDKKIVYVGMTDNLCRRQEYHWTGSGASSFRDHIRHDILLSGKRRRRKKGGAEVEVIEKVRDPLILNTIVEDDCQSHEQALLKFYMRLRPGNPPSKEKAKTFFTEKFSDSNRYRLGKVGRFRLNRKFKQVVDENEMTLRPEDFLNTMKYIVALRDNKGEVDDIDHLGNRRLRTIEELASDEIRKGLLKLRKTVQERMSMRRDVEESVRIADLVNSKSVSSSINYFFGRGELSQVVDQTNALSQLTHERRLSALGPGGLNRRRAGFEVRDVHISHYGRICPIETPEGTNIGLIASLAIFATIDEYGFLLTPYYKVKNGKVTDEEVYLRADEEMKVIFAPPSAVDTKSGKIHKGMVLARKRGELAHVSSNEVDYVDISPKQIVGVSASLIPFLEHDDANRALMGSNMQRQAVPLLKMEAPLVGTGMERVVGENSSMVVRAKSSGVVTAVDASRIVLDHTDEYKLRKFEGLNERTCLNQKPIVKLGKKVEKGQIIADGGGTTNGVLSLGKNVLVGFASFDGFNFEDAIIVSEKLCKNDSFTSIHIDEFTAEVRETRLGKEEFTRDIPNVSEKALRNLDEYGVVREGTRVCPGDILVGKVVPKSKTELTPEEKLLHAIFGRAGEDVKNDSLELPSGYEGVVIKTERFTRRGAGSEEEKKVLKAQMKQYRKEMRAKECLVFKQMIELIQKKFEVNIVDPSTHQKVGASTDNEVIYEQIENFNIKWVKPASLRDDAQKIVDKFWAKIAEIQEEKEHRIESLKHGDELPSGVLQMVKVYVAIKRALSIGDKIAGRHGNKGVIAKIMPEEDMPFLEDGTSLDILLNPLGVPSRMNVGQILETHLGWVAKVLGFNAITPVFDGATEDDIYKLTAEANEVMRLNNPYPPSAIELNGIQFQRVCPISPKPVDEDPGLRYENKDNLPRHKWGRGPFCEFKMPLIKEGGFYALVVGGHLAYIGECENLSDRFNKGYGSIQPKNCFEGGQGTNCRINTSILEANKEGVPIELYFNPAVLSKERREEIEKNLIESIERFSTLPWDLKHTGRKEPLSYTKGKVIYKASKQPPAADEFFVNVLPTLKTQLYDGRTGEPFDQTATIGYIYMMKLHHLVDDKIHARATGPYSLITQQPLGGKARTGGQRFGEMEVWALEGYGAAYTLQEMLTVKSDDVEGRTKIYESMVKGQNILEAGTPLSFDVLCNELRGLGLNIQLEKKRLGGTVL